MQEEIDFQNKLKSSKNNFNKVDISKINLINELCKNVKDSNDSKEIAEKMNFISESLNSNGTKEKRDTLNYFEDEQNSSSYSPNSNNEDDRLQILE